MIFKIISLLVDLYKKFVYLLIYCYIAQMFSILSKKIIWAILFWFAILQAVSPLIHAHIEIDTPQQGHGLHMHTDEVVQTQDKIPTLRSNLGISDTVGVNKAVAKDMKALPLPLLVFLFVLYSLITISQIFKPVLAFSQSPPFYLRPNSRPRAPPLF